MPNLQPRYQNLPPQETVQKAHSDFLEFEDHFGHIPASFESEHVCKMYAVDALRIVSEENPEAISQEVLEDLKARWNQCNPATKLGIIDLFQTTRRTSEIPFLEKIAKEPDIIMPNPPVGTDGVLQGEWHREAARDAIVALSA
jgi:hypothetical protein